MIFDNADQSQDLRAYVPSGPGDVLITSRNPAWQATAETVQVDVFTRAESTEFLARRTDGEATGAAAELLADKLGDLPLALDQAGAMLFETGMQVEEYVALLDEQIVKIMAEGRSAEYPLSMTAAWSISVDRVQQVLPQARDLLCCCAFFGPEPIPRDVFRRGSQATGTRVSNLMADPILLSRAIRELARFVLVTISGRSISVHRLVQALLRRISLAREEALVIAGDVFDAFNKRRGEGHPDTMAVAVNLSNAMRVNGMTAEALDRAVEIAERYPAAYGSDHPFALGCSSNVAVLRRVTGDPAGAREINETALEGLRARLGRDHFFVLAVAVNLASDLSALGETAAARALGEDTLTRASKVLGRHHPLILGCAANLSVDLGADGAVEAAEHLRSDTMKRYEDTLGLTHADAVAAAEGLRLDFDFDPLPI